MQIPSLSRQRLNRVAFGEKNSSGTRHFNIIGSGTYEFKPEADNDAEGDDAFIYKWNDFEVLYAQYNESLNAIYDTTLAVPGYDWQALLSYDEIMKYLENNYQEAF